MPSGTGPQLVTDLIEFTLDVHAFELRDRQARKQRNPPMQQHENLRKGALHRLSRTFHGGGIFDPPMGGHRLARPDGTDFTGCVIANREDELRLAP